MSITLFVFGASSAVDAAPFVGTVKVEVEVVTNSPLKAALAVSAFLVEVTLLFHIIVEMMFEKGSGVERYEQMKRSQSQSIIYNLLSNTCCTIIK